MNHSRAVNTCLGTSAVWLALAAAACSKQRSACQDGDASRKPARTSVAARIPAYAFTASELESFIDFREYQRRNALPAPSVSDRYFRELDRHNRAEDAQRDELGLSKAEVDAMEKIISAVLDARQQLVDMPYTKRAAQFVQLEAAANAAPSAEERAGWREVLAQKLYELADLQTLTSQREEFGSQNVDLILSREDDLKSCRPDKGVQSVKDLRIDR